MNVYIGEINPLGNVCTEWDPLHKRCELCNMQPCNGVGGGHNTKGGHKLLIMPAGL